MVIDKGLGLTAFRDMLQTSGAYIDIVKLGFGTPALYPNEILREKISLCRDHQITIIPGGTFLEVAIVKQQTDAFFTAIQSIGFDGIEVSDGTIELSHSMRNELIQRGRSLGFRVFSEYGKKFYGSKLETEDLIRTIHSDIEHGSEIVTIEGRESGKGVGIFDDHGNCDNDTIADILTKLPDPYVLMWEAPLKSQQAEMINRLGPELNLGNIHPEDVLALEALRRGLRSDTLSKLTK